MKRIRLYSIVGILCSAVAAFGFYAFQARTTKSLPLSAYAPSGARLSIESPHFSELLKTWNNSPEQKRWLASGDYAGFSRSRLFDRLGQAQDEFATTAGLAPDMRFLQQIAGEESLLAWYDIGNLEFLYITRLPAGTAARSPLLQLRDNYEERHAGDTTFYVRTLSDPARTVAFAVRGDYLILATREDLMAGALQLMQHPTEQNLRSDSWYSSTMSKAATTSDLHMALDLANIVHSPYFRSYWIQQNTTETGHYLAAGSDLFRTPDRIREERTLIAAHPDDQPTGADLTAVLNYLPANVGVYRAQSQPTVAQVLAQLDDKILTRAPGSEPDSKVAPTASLSTASVGDASDLDERIDTPPAVKLSHEQSLAMLGDLLRASPPTAMLTFSTATQPQQDSQTHPLFIPVHTAVVIGSETPWPADSVQSAMNAALESQLSVTAAPLTWTTQQQASITMHKLSGPQPLAFAIADKSLLIASDIATLQQLLTAHESATHQPRVATVVAGFSHSAESAPYRHIVSLLDHSNTAATSEDAAPAFFSGNLSSLSDTFRDLDTETFTESTAADHTVHQTVVYQWKH